MSLSRAARDAKRMELAFRYMARTGVQRVARNVAKDVADEGLKLAKRPGLGFVDRTGRLRASVRLEQARDVRGRFRSGYALVARTAYAGYVEYRRRTRDRRRGPPYFIGEVMRRLRRLARRRAVASAQRALAVEVGKARSGAR